MRLIKCTFLHSITKSKRSKNVKTMDLKTIFHFQAGLRETILLLDVLLKMKGISNIKFIYKILI